MDVATYTTMASYSCSISGYLPESHDYTGLEAQSRSTLQSAILHTGTSWAFTGLVATTLRTAAELENDLCAPLTAFRSCFLSMVAGEDDGVVDVGRKGDLDGSLAARLSARPNRQVPVALVQSRTQDFPHNHLFLPVRRRRTRIWWPQAADADYTPTSSKLYRNTA